ncbi:hypothetical protein EIM48_10220 [Pseudoxanthomonas sp. SGNA-20]|jgi:Ca2+-binding protein (EF-Hand superfamily)|uniref:EF hand domain-containing protein n=1 Tax=Pseudoxanthomonas taiwanensis J19 TaxID=935569 RepID=A0A562DH29_9GAMM|nr:MULTISPECIES: EF-hand domain-containing protein [Pseudoxanthomonas]RRN55498.1 hypothetical protein EIM48_10220 [Pseudoxanthomonas sp. SGNA-20]RRN79534.1 hypothetical protein EIM50_09805 [Pseudoxanthomonas sp. SGD-10]TWH08907.1 EF hand domain-containing protein [Pseudoxanthomonas taiwanensis J19]
MQRPSRLACRRPGRTRPGLLPWALLAFAGAAGAQVERTSEYLARMDSDGDGRVSQEEYVAWMGYAFERMDRDGDGVLSPAEQPGGKGRPISLEEHRRRLAERFARQDANGDGYLDARELAAPPR